jgi:hypothetical protein
MMWPSREQEMMTMALGKRQEEQQEMWVATTSLPKSVGHVFYRKLNRLLREADFDHAVEKKLLPGKTVAVDTIELAESLGVRTYIPERKTRGKRKWRDMPEEKRQAFLNNHRRVRGARSKRLQRQWSELVERSFAHVCGRALPTHVFHRTLTPI